MKIVNRVQLTACGVLLAAALWFAAWPAAAAQELTREVEFNIPSQRLADAILQFSEQTSVQVVTLGSDVSGLKSSGVSGKHRVEHALRLILQGTGLTFNSIGGNTVSLVQAPAVSVAAVGEGLRVAQTQTGDEAAADERAEQGREAGLHLEELEEAEEETKGLPEVLVRGSRVLNTDIKRTMDDVQPYVVFDRDVIERSGASDLHEFLKNNLTMNVVPDTMGQGDNWTNRSSVNLRGLGSDETLILIDGRRAPPAANGSDFGQADLNGIPLAAIERIEVLPTTASGIYGGGATGGVINVVLRHDYSGIEGKATYAGTVDGGGGTRQIDMSTGFNIGSKTKAMLFGSYLDSDPVLVGQRNLIQRARRHVHATNPAFFFGGVPPVGATPNIRSNDGQDLVLDSGVPLNSTFTFVPAAYPGAAADGGMALVANAGQYNLDLSPTAEGGGSQSGLLSGSETKSLRVTLRQELSSRVEAFLELQASNNTSHFPHNRAWFGDFEQNLVVLSADAPNNPFQQSIQVVPPAVGLDGATINEYETRSAVGGVIVSLPADWRSTIEYSWGQSNAAFVTAADISFETLQAMSSSSLDVLRDLNQLGVALEANPFPAVESPGADATLSDIAVRLAGPVPLTLPGGKPHLSILFERRKESLDDAFELSGGGGLLFPSRSQEVKSLYLESQFPLVAAHNSLSWLKLLELQLAVRRDDYSVTGATNILFLPNTEPVQRLTREDSSTNPTLGLRIQPMQDLTLRASYATGYLPPAVDSLVRFAPFVTGAFRRLSVQDPLRGNEVLGNIQVDQGGNPNLGPEESESWSAGFIFTPRWVPELRLSADWSRISKTNNIGSLGVSQDSLDDLIAYFPERVRRAAPSDGFPVGRITEIDLTLLNLAAQNVEALDLSLNYSLQTKFGVLDFSLGATRLFSVETQSAPSAPVVERLGLLAITNSGGGLKWKGNASLKWDYRGWSLGWRTRYFDSYFLRLDRTIVANQGSATVPHQSYHDLFGGYRFSPASAHSVFADAEIQFGISNVLNKEPPVDVGAFGGGSYSSLGDPRLARYFVSFKKAFGR